MLNVPDALPRRRAGDRPGGRRTAVVLVIMSYLCFTLSLALAPGEFSVALVLFAAAGLLQAAGMALWFLPRRKVTPTHNHAAPMAPTAPGPTTPEPAGALAPVILDPEPPRPPTPASLTHLAGAVVALDGLLADDQPASRRAAPELFAGGDPLEVLALDLEDRQLALARRTGRLLAERDTLRAMIDAVDVPVFMTDTAGAIERCNGPAQELLARRRDRVVGLTLDEVFTQRRLIELHDRALQGIAGRAEVAISDDGGQRIFDAAAVPLTVRGAPAGAVLSLRDITELATAVQLKTDFVANASHELRTPIASIRAAIETMQTAADDPAMVSRLLRMMSSNVARLESMIGDLLDLSRVESPTLTARVEPVPGSDLAELLAQMFERPSAERGLELAFELHPDLEHLRTDRHLLQLILRNLVENATKFAFEGTVVRIVGEPIAFTTGAAPADPTLFARGTPRGVRFRVIDRGIGIPLKFQQRIFERFFQVDPSRTRQAAGRGTGLGLAIVKHAVRQLHGRIEVDSVWQEGTTMTVELPDCLPPADAAPGPA